MTPERESQLQPGDMIGGHRIEARLGAGGMGEVYLAQDARLNRKVAIKVLPESKVHDADAHARIVREARAAAALNHQNLCTIHEVGEDARRSYIVMEFVDGKSLDALIPKNGLPPDKALRYARDIAAGMAHAHDRGIVHRDLKPANIMIAPDGVLKILDFGLATFSADAGGTQTTMGLTAPGTVMGTAAYMSPEQAEGKPVDKRTDIWAFGVVVYQMLTGKGPFTADSVAATMAAIMTTEPDFSVVPASTRRMLTACLEKDPARRLRDIGDAWALVDAGDRTGGTSPLGRWAPVAAGLAAGLVIGGATWAYVAPSPAPAPSVIRWSTTLVEGGGGERGLAISRDGKVIAYTGRALPVRPIWVRALDEAEGRALPGTEGGRRPFFSPDGKWLAYFSGVGRSSLMKVSLAGGTPTRLCENAGYLGGSWADNDQIVATGHQGLLRVTASGGECEQLTKADPANGRAAHRSPQLLPGGRTVLFGIGVPDKPDDPQIALLDLASRQIRVLEQRGSSARYLPSGHLVYARGTALFAVAFDVDRLQSTGPEVHVVDGVLMGDQAGRADYAVSDDGMLLYTSAQTTNRTLDWIDFKDGTVRRTVAASREYGTISLSPDGRTVATALTSGGAGIHIVDLERGTVSQISSSGVFPVWTPDARRIVFTERGGGLQWVSSDGAAAPEVLDRELFATPESISPDGQTLFFTVTPSRDPNSQESTRTLSLAGAGRSGAPWPVTTTRSERGAHISPDGKWIAYVSNESGQYQVYVRAYPGPSGKIQISIDGGEQPRWSRQPQALFFRNLTTNQLMTADLPVAGKVTPPRSVAPMSTPLWDVAPDGTRALFVANPGADTDSSTVRVVMNWFEELRRATGAR